MVELGDPLKVQFTLDWVVLTVLGKGAFTHTVGGKLTDKVGFTTEMGSVAVREHWLLSVTVNEMVCCPEPKETGPGVGRLEDPGLPLLNVQAKELRGPGIGEPLEDKLPVMVGTKGGEQPVVPREEKISTFGGLDACTVPPEEAIPVQLVTASTTVRTGTKFPPEVYT